MRPQFEGRIVAGVTATDVLQDFEDRNCLGVVIFQDAWENAQAGNTPTTAHDGSSPELNHCDKVIFYLFLYFFYESLITMFRGSRRL